MSQLGALSIRIQADGSQAQRELGNVNSSVRESDARLRENANRWGRWAAAATAAAAGVAAAIVRYNMQSIDELGKMARQLNINVESLQALRHQAELSGVSSSELDSNLDRLTRRLGQTARGGGRAAESIESLGISVEELANMRPDEQMDMLAQALGNVSSHSERAAIASDLFGRSGVRMLGMLDDMEQGLDPVVQRLEEMGAILTQEEVTMVENANDAIHEAGVSLNTVWQRAAVELAPIIQAVSEEIVIASAEMGGFGNTALDVMDGVARATGVVADSFRGWQIIVRGSVVAFRYMQRDFIAMLQNMSRMWDGFINLFKSGINELIRAANVVADVLPFAGPLKELEVGASETTQNLHKMWNDLNVEFSDAIFELQKTAAQPMPSEGIDRWVENVREGARQAAEEIRMGMSGQVDGEEGEDDSFAFTREENEKWLEQLRERYQTQAEIEEEAHADELERLRELKEMGLLTEQEYEEERERMAKRHADSMAEIQDQERRQRTAIVGDMMNNLSQLMNTGSRRMFEIGKAAAIANALVQGREAVVSSYAAGARIGGPPVGAAFAATAAAATAAQISQIRSSSFGEAGGTTTFTGGVPATRTTPAGDGQGAGTPGQTIDLNITGTGSRFTADEVRGLIDQINEQVGDGVNLSFSGG